MFRYRRSNVAIIVCRVRSSAFITEFIIFIIVPVNVFMICASVPIYIPFPRFLDGSSCIFPHYCITRSFSAALSCGLSRLLQRFYIFVLSYGRYLLAYTVCLSTLRSFLISRFALCTDYVASDILYLTV